MNVTVRRIVLHGILWGVLASALEWLIVGTREAPPDVTVDVLLYIMPGWCIVGAALAAWIEIAGPRLLRPVFFVSSTLGCALVLSGMWSLLYVLQGFVSGYTAISTLFPNGTNAFAAYLYQVWIIVFYGGLYFFAWSLNHRAERTRRLLTEAQVARLCAETALGELQLATLREQVDPQFLLRVLVEAERRYTADHAAADQLIARLVAFLRLAMPGVRAGRSLLVAELELAQAYAALCADIGIARAAWSITWAPPLPDIVLPPLLVVAMLESIPAPSRVRLHAAVEDERVVLRLDAPLPTGWLRSDRAYRVQVALSALYGNDWSFEQGNERATVLSLPNRKSPHRHKETIDA